jgi:hypothetical protein
MTREKTHHHRSELREMTRSSEPYITTHAAPSSAFTGVPPSRDVSAQPGVIQPDAHSGGPSPIP